MTTRPTEAARTHYQDPLPPVRSPTPAQSAAASYLTSLLNRPLRILISDNRTFIGIFICVDKACNIMLSHAEEFRPPLPGGASAEEWKFEEDRARWWPVSMPEREGGWGGREMGLITIPGKEVVRIEIEEGEAT